MVQQTSLHNSLPIDTPIHKTSVDQQRLQQNRQLLLMQLAQGNSLQRILNSLILSIESTDATLTGAVLIRQNDNDKLDVIAAPSLDPSARQALIQAESHIGGGICGQAFLSGERIVYTNFRHHPCPACRNLGGMPQFAACWAEPMRNRQGEIIGIFALYNRQPNHPDLKQIALLTHSASLARLAIERCREKLALSLAHTNWQSSRQATVVTDLEHRVLSCNALFTTLSGYQKGELLDKNLWKILNRNTSGTLLKTSIGDQQRSWAGELWLHKQHSQQLQAVWVSIDMIFNKNGVICGQLVRLYPITDWNGQAVTCLLLKPEDH